jgi:DNA-binding LacI/PurR family transcriptional regulator/AraC-like DNA-binding protein
MAGALRYADSNSRVIIRCFAPTKNLATAAAELENWGADGVLAILDHDDLDRFMASLKRPIPIVNNALAKDHPSVLTILADFQAFVETAVGHFRQLGLRSLAVLVTEEGPAMREQLVGTFLRIAQPPSPSRASLVFQADRDKLWDPHAVVKPVPAALADWLRSLPKPTGILCPALGCGGYLVRCCQALGLRVPEDIAVIGGDDTDLSLACEPTVSSIVPAVETLGFEAARLLRDLIAGKRPDSSVVRFKCMDLQVRESTGLRKPEICDIGGALQFIHENACRGTTVEQVIKQTQRVSKVTFHRRFQDVVGKSPAEAIRDRKLDEVRRLLTTTDLPLTMISDLSGFSSAKVMARVFRGSEGVTLRDFRKHKKKQSQTGSKTTHLRLVLQQKK